MQRNVLVSVVMPAFNAEKYIGCSIESVVHQTYQNWELIIVNDGSTDNTQEVIDRFMRRDKRIRCVQQKNGKQGKARNAGIKIAMGELIAFLDADDLWYPVKLEKQVAILEQQNTDLVFCYADQINSKGEKVGGWPPAKDDLFFFGDEGVAYFFRGNIVNIFTVLAKREAIQRVNGFNEEAAIQNIEDYDLWLRMLYNNCRFLLMNEVLGAYRLHGTQTIKGKPVVLKILRMLDSMRIERKVLVKEKRNAMRLWIIRGLKYDINKGEFWNLISFYPNLFARKLFKTLFFIIPQNFLNKIILISCKERLLRNSLYYVKQKLM